MCGIVGLFAKSAEVEARLGVHLAAMLEQMSDRGPDSAGVAVYRDPAPYGSSKLTLYSADPDERWGVVRDGLCDAFGTCAEPAVRASHAVFVVDRAGRNLTQLTEHSVNAQHPVWSPDGKWLIFSAQPGEQADVFGLARISIPKLPR